MLRSANELWPKKVDVASVNYAASAQTSFGHKEQGVTSATMLRQQKGAGHKKCEHKILHVLAHKCLTGEVLRGNILGQLRRATATVLTTVEIIGNESNFVE